MNNQQSSALRGLYIYDDADMRHIATQVPSDDIARGIIVRAQRNRQTLSLAAEKHHQIGNAAVIDVRIGTRLMPFFFGWIVRPILDHVFVDFLLKIDADGAIGTNDFVGADTRVRGDVSAGIVEMDIRRDVLHGMICAFDRRGDEFVQELLTRISGGWSDLREAEGGCEACAEKDETSCDSEGPSHTHILPANSSAPANARGCVREVKRARLRQRAQKCLNRCIVAKRLTDVREAVHISGCEDEAAAELERILT